MTGTVDTMSVEQARKDSVSQQSRLGAFGSDEGTTYIGIANADREDYLDAVDETEERLAPPDELFWQWYNTRQRMMDNGQLERNAHNEALETVNYFERFEDYLNEPEPQAALTQITERVRDGEEIVLVCYCGEGKQCHRHPVAERITARL
jgi:hypothetical protein